MVIDGSFVLEFPISLLGKLERDGGASFAGLFRWEPGTDLEANQHRMLLEEMPDPLQFAHPISSCATWFSEPAGHSSLFIIIIAFEPPRYCS